jgi:molybdenum cofactor guanylyltransferase
VDAQSSVKPRCRRTVAAIIAGGAGTRMGGIAKGLLQVQGRCIIEQQLDLLRPLFSRVIVITNDEYAYSYLGVPLIADRFGGGLGPLSGVHTALASLLNDESSVVCIAADMPFLSSPMLRLLRDHQPEDLAMVPFVNGFPEPLCARYPKAALPTITHLIEQGRLKMHEALALIGAHRLPDSQWQDFDPLGRFATNVNTPASLAEANVGATGYKGL